MEEWQREIINKNLPELIHLTRYTPDLKAKLKSKGVLVDVDIAGLDALMYVNSYDQVYRLYDILKRQQDGFEAIVSSLYETGQSAAGQLLVKDYKFDSREQLYEAVQQGDLAKTLQLLRSSTLSGIKSAIIVEEELLHKCVKNSINDNPQTIENKKQIIQFLTQASVNCMTNILDQPDSEQRRPPLLQENVAFPLLQCLVSASAFVNVKDMQNNNILHLIPRRGGISPEEYHKIVEYFLSYGVFVNEQNNKMETPLHVAVQCLDLIGKTFELFKRKQANFNITDANGNGLIHLVASKKCRSPKLITGLIPYCTNWNEKNNSGETALDLALKMENYKAVAVLVVHFAERSAGRYGDAIGICEKEQDKLATALDAEFLDTLAIPEAKASILCKLNRQEGLKEALAIFTNGYECRSEILGEEHEDTLIALNGKADALLKLGKLNEAYQVYSDVYEKRRKLFGEDHVDTLSSKNGMAVAVSKQNRFDEASTIFQQVLDQRTATLGEDHLDTISTLYDMGRQLMAQKKYSGPYGAIIILEKVFNKRKELLGEAHDATLMTQVDLCECYARLERWTETLKILEDIRRAGGERSKAYVSDSQMSLFRTALRFREVTNGCFIS